MIVRGRTLSFAIILLIFMGVFVFAATNEDLISGRNYALTLESNSDTDYWSGLTITNSAGSLSLSTSPFLSLTLNNAIISETTFAGANLNDGSHYYAATFETTFSVSNIVNVSDTTLLEANGLFNSTNYPQFYPDYTNKSDNPNETFCCSITTIPIAGRNYTAYNLTLPSDVEYYVVRYDINGSPTPLFLSKFENSTCYNSTFCVSQFLLPVSNTTYNFYILSEDAAYDYTVYIDEVLTTAFTQVGLPYNLTFQVFDLFANETMNNTDVVVGEQYGKTLFIPYRLNGYIRDIYSIGRTNGSGWESFLVAPTGYPSVTNYDIYIGVLAPDGTIASPFSLSVTTDDSLVQQSKSITPTRLSDNAKASVNSMNQIGNFLFIWSSQREEAKSWDITYELSNDTWTIYDEVTLGSTLVMKTGAPNVIDVDIESLGGPAPGYTYRLVEEGGFLIMNPYTDNQPLTPTARVARQEVDSGTEIVVTPTTLGSIDSNITIQILNSSGGVVGSYSATIDPDLNIATGGISYDNDLLKTIANSMNQIISSLFYSLNF